jgi:hypothetical protein
MKTKAQKLKGGKKPGSLEELKQKYFSTPADSPARRVLFALIRAKDPKFKG